jgi:hypothetical protein
MPKFPIFKESLLKHFLFLRSRKKI